MTRGTDVVVVGSLNLDLVLSVARRPAAGETVMGDAALWAHGGKGANQAAAAARAGAATAMVGAVGNDDAGRGLVPGLHRVGVDCSGVAEIEGVSGTAVITVTGDGENCIVVVPGANAALAAGDTSAALAMLAPPGRRTSSAPGGPVVLAQLEVPMNAVAAAAAAAKSAGGRFVLNASPIRALTDELSSVVALADPLIVNEGEAATLLAGSFPAGGCAATAQYLVQLGARSAVVTAGAEGAGWASRDSAQGAGQCAAVSVDRVVDTTGAGDAFAGALAAALSRGEPLDAAVRVGAAAGAAAVGWPGARPGQPPA